jgi:SAM-dependent methyltransferase
MKREPLQRLTGEQLREVSAKTIAHYQGAAESFREGTKDHDVSQNVAALLGHLDADPPYAILDLGCGPGRDLMAFRALGHRPVGLDGTEAFVEMARAASACEVLHQDLLQMDLPSESFDGVFANAVLFHVPSQELPRVLGELWATLRPGGVLFASNPRGPDLEQWQGLRYSTYLSWPTWRDYAVAARFERLEHYYRPTGRPREQQPWLASVWRKPRARRLPVRSAIRR